MQPTQYQQEEASRRRAYLYERYGRIAAEFKVTEGLMLKDFFNGIETTTQTDSDSGLPHTLLFNEKRTERFGKIPSFVESIKTYLEGEPSNVIFAREYPLYYLAANPVPIVYGALTIIREPFLAYQDLKKFYTINNEVDEQSLETMLTMSDELRIRIFHNMDGAGASKIEPHWQAIMDSIFRVESARREELNRHYGIYTMPDYPGDNVIFTGQPKLEESLQFTQFLDSTSIENRNGRTPYVVLIAENEIYVIPVKDENAGAKLGLNARSRIAGYELGNCGYVALSMQDFERVKSKQPVKINEEERPLTVREILKSALYERGVVAKKANHILKRV